MDFIKYGLVAIGTLTVLGLIIQGASSLFSSPEKPYGTYAHDFENGVTMYLLFSEEKSLHLVMYPTGRCKSGEEAVTWRDGVGYGNGVTLRLQSNGTLSFDPGDDDPISFKPIDRIPMEKCTDRP